MCFDEEITKIFCIECYIDKVYSSLRLLDESMFDLMVFLSNAFKNLLVIRLY